MHGVTALLLQEQDNSAASTRKIRGTAASLRMGSGCRKIFYVSRVPVSSCTSCPLRVPDNASKFPRPLEAWMALINGFSSAPPLLNAVAAYLVGQLGMPTVNVSLVDAPSCGVDKCKKHFGGDMLSGFHWDSICYGCIPYRNMRHDLVRDIWYRAFLELGISDRR